MNEHFRAFSFVDRISSITGGNRIQGQYTIPVGLTDFPPSLAAEAVGQLAAWLAMKETNFERRPVAGLAGKIELAEAPRPGKILQLAVDLESLDEEAVAYRGAATSDGELIVRLEDCVGPMIPVVELDDPVALRGRFDVLCGPGAAPDGVTSLPELSLHRIEGESGQYARATFHVPASAAMFADHFPRRPVFPGSLLMQISLQLAGLLSAEIPVAGPLQWRAQSVMDMKLREFVPPGKRLELEARLKQRADHHATLSVGARAGNEVVSSARLLLVAEARA